MPSFILGIRKFVEEDQVKYWLLITAKAIPPEDNEGEGKVAFSAVSFNTLYIHLVNSLYWKIFLVVTIMFNLCTFISYFWLNPTTVNSPLLLIIVLVHLTCIFYWIDFVGAIIERIVLWHHPEPRNPRPIFYLVLDLLSLIPISTVYLIAANHIDIPLLWKLRSITLLRFYYIPRFFSQISKNHRNPWNILLVAYTIYLILFIIIFANIFLCSIHQYSPVNIKGWNDSSINRIIVSLYYALETVLNVGYGDIEPMSYGQIVLCAFAMTVGTAANNGVFCGILGNAYTIRAHRRENYRYEYEATKNTLRERHIDKKVMGNILDNMNMLWKWKKGYTEFPPVHILPLSLIKELYFDVNFPNLHRSLIFSPQPRSFLRSVAMLMTNVTYLPGDIIMEPAGFADVMICVASGVIEVLSPQNDESVLFSLTMGTIIGEASLFFPVPIRCVIRASTYVELQVLKKVHFARLALTYREIIRSMRSEVLFRLKLKEQVRPGTTDNDIKSRRYTKKFLTSLKNIHLDEDFDDRTVKRDKQGILRLYALSENIPRVKTLPINLIRARPWILRPDTTFTKFWKLIMMLVVISVCIIYPVTTAFIRKIEPSIYVILLTTRTFYIVDVYLQCTTALERKDHFTYKTSIKEIITYKLTTVGFYLDVIAMYYLGIYAELVWPEDKDYAVLLLSLNTLLKAWQVFSYMKELENDMGNNWLFIITIKYATAICFLLTWGAALLYLEARPGETYVEDRWFYDMEMKAANDTQPHFIDPVAVSFYFAAVTTFALGYGDLVAQTIVDCVVVIICMCSGFILIIFCVAESSAAFKHLARIRTTYQEELFAVDLFISEHVITQGYRQRVRNYMRLQWDYDRGYSLKQISIRNTHPGLQRRIIMMELSKSFLCVPLFRDTDPDFLKLLAKLCKVRVLPPQELVMRSGSFTREMYIIENGFCEVTKMNADDSEKKIIGPFSPLGVLEMILGEPQRLQVETVTHVRVISLNYSLYLQAVTKYPEVKLQVEEDINTYNYNDQDEDLGFGYEDSGEKEDKIRLKKQNEILSKTIINVRKYYKIIDENYWDPFQAWGKCRFLQYLLLPISVNPNTTWFKTWVIIRVIKALVIGIICPLRFSLIDELHQYMPIITTLQVLYAFDIYIMFHVAYYNNQGLLMFHPAKTVLRYLKGNFILDLIIVFPFYWLLNYLYPNAEDYRGFSIKTSGLIMTLQLYLFFQGFQYLEYDILKKTDLIKILKLLPIVIIVINFITALVLLIQCYMINRTNQPEFEGSTRLAQELVNSVMKFCAPNKNQNVTNTRTVQGQTTDQIIALKMYVITLYWVTTTITVCGFGDIWANNETTMVIVVLILSLGIFFFSYTYANITSSMVNTNVVISKYRQRMLEMMKFLRKANVSLDLQHRYRLHYEYNWKRTEGQSPQKIFSYLPSALREGIIKSMYEATLNQNPIFKGLENAILSIISKHLNEMYFLQGETIVKYRDIQDHMYLIYRGEVHVLNEKNEFISSMGKGGMFGNISNKPFSLSSETVVASENTDLLRLDVKTFFSQLQDNSRTNKLLAYLKSKKENYVLPNPEQSEVGNSVKLNLFRLKTVPPERRGTSSSQIYHISAFTCRNMVFFFRVTPFKSFIILPETMLSNGIEMCIFGMAYLSAVLTIYMFAFQDFSPHILAILYFVDMLFLIELYLQFHMSPADKFGDVVVSTKSIKKRYFKSKKFYFDIITNAPIEVFLFASSRNWWEKLLSILRLNRVLRLHYVLTYYSKNKKELMTNKIILEIGWMVVLISLLIHTLSCVWFVAVCPLGYLQEPTWVTEMNLQGRKAWEYYIYSAFHIIIITTTTGLQKLRLYSYPEITLTMIFMITCRYVVVLTSAVLFATINANSHTLFQFQDRMIELKENFSRQNMSSYQLHKMWNYLTTLWRREKGRQIPKFISSAPYTMKCDVMLEMFGKHFLHSYVFSQADPTFLRQLVSHLKRFVYFPGNYIVQQGDIDYTMYFINKGEVSVLTIHPELIETIHFTLHENDQFGMKQGYIIGKAHEFSYRAQTEVEILSLTLSDWQHLLRYFPKEAKKITQKMESIPKGLK